MTGDIINKEKFRRGLAQRKDDAKTHRENEVKMDRRLELCCH